MKTISVFKFNIRGLRLVIALLAASGWVTQASAEQYLIDLNTRTVTDLGTLGGYGDQEATGINDAGQVVGYSYTLGGGLNSRAFITDPDGMGIRDLGTLGGSESVARSINATGQVVGYSRIADGSAHAFITGPDGTGMRDLGGHSTHAEDINHAGQVVGWSRTAADDSRAFITGPDGAGIRDLGTLGGRSSHATGINDAGQVTGWFRMDDGTFGAFITGPDGVDMRDLGTLGGRFAIAEDINSAGQVVGWSQTGTSGDRIAFITGPDGVGMRDLGTLAGGTWDGIHGINDAAQVVGESVVVEGMNRRTHAFITGPDGEGMTDLNTLVDLPAGVMLLEGLAINNVGQVIAYGSPPIPEPESYALLLAGLALIGAVVRRRNGEVARLTA